MLTLREEELNMINGGNAAKGMLGGAKYNVGDKVISKSAPDGGVGTVEKSKYDKGWWYSVRMQAVSFHAGAACFCIFTYW